MDADPTGAKMARYIDATMLVFLYLVAQRVAEVICASVTNLTWQALYRQA
jgi:hypothetical protein